jgi:putative nucleotidyltransferase with HDIG domain
LLLVLSISLILSFYVETLPGSVQVGKVAPKDIKADRNYEIIDVQATEANRQEAFRSVLPVYDFNDEVAQDIDRRIQEAFQGARAVLKGGEEFTKSGVVFMDALGISLAPAKIQVVVRDKFSPEGEWILRRLVSQAMTRRIVPSRGVLPGPMARGVDLRELVKNAPVQEVHVENLQSFLSLEEAQSQMASLAAALASERGKRVNPASFVELASALILPNTTFNSGETELRRARAVGNVPNVIIKVQGGEMIIRSGDRFDPIHLTILEGIRRQKTETSFAAKFIGTALFVTLLLLITYAIPKKYVRKFNPTREDLFFLSGILLLLLLIVRLSAALSSALRDLFPFDVPVQTLYYAIPVAGGAMLVRYILNSEIALVFAIVTSALAGVFFQTDFDLSVYYLISSIVAAGAIGQVGRRSSILWAGVVVGVVNVLIMVGIKLITIVSATDVFNAPQILLHILMGLLGGVSSAIFVMVFSPMVEAIFNYVTDIKLLELGNLNHPLLREMIVKAPGTYHHSQLVAVLAEAAAAEIGANPLLARVGSYFHDIGKMRKPAYFIENQQDGVNRHDKLAPSMSALIIAAHVKDGLEMAREYHLPQRITDFIPQHQGTKLISYFYKKALEASEAKDAPVDEKHYRYPGPRPQNREAGIILLADGVEASVRSLPEKSPQKIQAKVQQIINNNFIEEQLDECEMTLKDLHVIAQTFTRVLVGIYHQRVEYPEVEEKKATITPLKPITKKTGP